MVRHWATSGLSTNIKLLAGSRCSPTRVPLSISHDNFQASTAQFPQIPIFLPSLCPHNSLRLSLEPQLGKHLRLEPIPPICSSVPPWTLALPIIRLDLVAIPRSPNSIEDVLIFTPNSTYQKLMNFPTITSGFKSGARIGYAFSINDVIILHHLRNFASIFLAELLAI